MPPRPLRFRPAELYLEAVDYRGGVIADGRSSAEAAESVAGATALRSLGLSGAPNARDLGGLPTVDGRRVKTGVLFRGPGLGYLSDQDAAVLHGLGLRTVLDLRYGPEAAHTPADRLVDGVTVVGLPIYDPAFPVFTVVGQLLQGEGDAAYADVLAQGTPAAMAAIYRWFVSDPVASAQFAAAVRRIAAPGTRPALFHCSAGKDRTGWLTVVVLTAVGVAPDLIRRDYLDTNVHSAPVVERILAAMVGKRPDLDLAVVRPLFEARPEFLDAALDEVNRRYGSMAAYLSGGLGLTAAERDGLRAALLTD